MLDPIRDEDWPPELAHLKDSFLGRANIYRTMAHHPALLNGWTGFRDHIVTGNRLGPQRSEVAILRVAHRLDVAYEWAHHVLRARDAGLSDARIRAVRCAPERMEADDALIARATDGILDGATVPAADARAIIDAAGKEALLDLIALVGAYRLIATVLKTFDVPIDEDTQAALARAPLD